MFYAINLIVIQSTRVVFGTLRYNPEAPGERPHNDNARRV